MDPWPVTVFDVIDSTNDEAKRRASQGVFEDQWLIARRQTAGRGRRERTWISEPGNLFASALFHEPSGFVTASRLPFVAALAVADTVDDVAGRAVSRLKWPNDVRIDGRKISGVLIETGRAGEEMWVVVGIGINVAHAPALADQPATCLEEIKGTAPCDLDVVFRRLAERFGSWLAEARNGFAPLRSAWIARADGLGGPVRVMLEEGPIEGRFIGLDLSGALVLQLPNGDQRLITAGDVNLIGRQ